MRLIFNELVKKYNMKFEGVLHIGAHYGEEHDLYEYNKIKRIAYFEPLKSNFSILESRIGDGAELYNIALGQYNQEIEMFVETANGGQSSSVLEPDLHLIQYPKIVFDHKETVQMRRLDDVIDNSKKEYNFINIDVQGYELEVFKGSRKTLENVDYILSEINRAELYKNCTKIDELKKFLAEFGFVLVLENWVGITWGEGLFIKQ